MKAIWVTAVGVGAMGIGLAHAVNSVPFTASRPQKNAFDRNWTCRLDKDCVRFSKIPEAACLVSGTDAKTQDACAVDGMKLIGKFTIEPTFLL